MKNESEHPNPEANRNFWLAALRLLRSKKIIPLIVSASVLGAVLADKLSKGGYSEHEAGIASEITSEFGKQNIESLVRLARESPVEQVLVIANGQDITERLDVQTDQTSIRKINFGPMLDSISRGEEVEFAHTHTAKVDDRVPELLRLNIYDDPQKLLSEGDFLELYEKAQKGQMPYFSNPPSTGDAMNFIALEWYKRYKGAPQGGNYVFGGSGIWGISVDFENPAIIEVLQRAKITDSTKIEDIPQYMKLRADIITYNDPYIRRYKKVADKYFYKQNVMTPDAMKVTVRQIISEANESGLKLSYIPSEAILGK